MKPLQSPEGPSQNGNHWRTETWRPRVVSSQRAEKQREEERDEGGWWREGESHDNRLVGRKRERGVKEEWSMFLFFPSLPAAVVSFFLLSFPFLVLLSFPTSVPLIPSFLSSSFRFFLQFSFTFLHPSFLSYLVFFPFLTFTFIIPPLLSYTPLSLPTSSFASYFFLLFPTYTLSFPFLSFPFLISFLVSFFSFHTYLPPPRPPLSPQIPSNSSFLSLHFCPLLFFPFLTGDK